MTFVRIPWFVSRRAIAGSSVLVLAVGCVQGVSLGSWNTPPAESSADESSEAPPPPPDGATSSQVETTPDAGPPVSLPACQEAAAAGDWSAIGPGLTATETSTDWNLPNPVPSLSWSLMIERDAPANAEGGNGYYWLQQFSFVNGVSGRFGLQSQGAYQRDPPDGPFVVAQMAVFWLSGNPLAAELGDIAYPDARIAPQAAAGTDWLTIHARFEWEVCHVYHFQVRLDSTEPDGSMWYGAWIDNTTTNVSTLLGRMLLPADTGLLSPFSVSRTIVIDYALTSCSAVQPGAAVFGAPYSGTAVAKRSESRFAEPLGCAPSRFTEFPQAVRHELGGPPPPGESETSTEP